MDKQLKLLAVVKQRVSTAVDLVSVPQDAKDVKMDRMGWFPIKSPITIKSLMQLVHTVDLMKSMRSLLDKLLAQLKEFRDEVLARTAWLAQRRNFVTLLATLPVFKIGVEVLLLMIKEILSHTDFAATVDFVRQYAGFCDFPTFLWTMTERMIALSVN